MRPLMLTTLVAVCAAAMVAGCAANGKERSAVSESTAPQAAGERTVEAMPEGCVRELFTVPSPSMKRDIRAAVVLPPCYKDKPAARYPVLYAMHGMGAPYTTFTDMSPLRKFMVDHPMILVCFDGDRASGYIDSTEKPESQFTTFFFDELMPYVAKHYRTSGREALTGFSMGGFGSMHYLLTRPEAFTSASSLSGAFMLFAPPPPGGQARRSDLLGDYETNKEAYARCAVHARLEAWIADGKKLPPLLLTCGTEDRLIKANRDFVNFLAEQNQKIIDNRIKPEVEKLSDKDEQRARFAELQRRWMIDFTYVETPGAHDWPYWRGMSEEIARFHWKHFQAAADGEP